MTNGRGCLCFSLSSKISLWIKKNVFIGMSGLLNSRSRVRVWKSIFPFGQRPALFSIPCEIINLPYYIAVRTHLLIQSESVLAS